MSRIRYLAAALIALFLTAEVVFSISECRAAENQQTQPPMQEEAALYTQYLQEKGYSEILSYNSFEDDYSMEVTEETVEMYSLTACLIDLNGDGVCELLVTLEDSDMNMSRSGLLTIDNGAVKQIAAAGNDGGTIGGSDLQLKYNSALQEYAVVKTSVIRDGLRAFDHCLSIYSNDALFNSHDLRMIGYDLSTYYSEDADAIRAETDLYLIEDGYFYSFMLDSQYITKTLYDTLMNSFVDPEDPDALFSPGSYSSPITGPALMNGAVD